MKSTTKNLLRKPGNWIFTILAVSVTIIACINGQIALSVWPLLATAFHWTTSAFQTLAEDAIEYGDAMMLANLEQSKELIEEKMKVADLQAEIQRLKKA